MKKTFTWDEIGEMTPGGLASIPMMVTTVQSMVAGILPGAHLPRAWLDGLRDVIAKRERVTFALDVPSRGISLEVTVTS